MMFGKLHRLVLAEFCSAREQDKDNVGVSMLFSQSVQIRESLVYVYEK